MPAVHLRLLASEFQVCSNCPDFLSRFATYVPQARQDFALSRCDTLSVTWTGDEYRIEGGGAQPDFEFDPASTVDAVWRRVFLQAAGLLSDHLFILGGICGVAEGKGFLVIGPPRSGRTTLAVALALRGYEVSGDDLVLLLDGKAVAWPRRFLLPEVSVALLPALANQEAFRSIAAMPRVNVVVPTDPAELGHAWHIRPVEPATVVCLEASFGARSRLRVAQKREAIGRIMPLCAAPTGGRPDWLHDLCRTVDSASTYVLELGDIGMACDALDRAFRSVR